ncbi:hypothetical protein [Rhodospirillum centenum]|uniref:Uncharacterized protein n=1 Tax=Rhodospirillum centenum (strain ATCC 51521 / SW) TaxID=414684 RepID=B6IVA2_RHOCS|nr:hypothetical protein [Rhodospirillum centenum]ACJ00226.1 hypothetical protein RC1_2856 [Rhodospirillum centenum SW]
MTESRRDMALAIKRCLESLAADAQSGKLHEVAYLIGIAALAAEDAARAAEPVELAGDLLHKRPMGHC